MAKGFTKIGRGLYTDEKGNIGKLVPTGKGGWYIKSLDELPKEVKKYEKYKDQEYLYKQLEKDRRYSAELSDERVIDAFSDRRYMADKYGELSKQYEDANKWYKKALSDRVNRKNKLEEIREERQNYLQNVVIPNEYGIDVKEKQLNNLRQAGKGTQAKVREGTPLQSMADQRVHEVEETLYNDKTMLNYAKSKKLNGVGGMTTQQLEEQIKQKEKYIRIAKGDKYLKEVDDRINSVETDISPMSEYSDTTGTGYSDRQMKAYKDYLLKTQGTTDENIINAGREPENRVSIEKFEAEQAKIKRISPTTYKKMASMNKSNLITLAKKYNINTEGLNKEEILVKLKAIFSISK